MKQWNQGQPLVKRFLFLITAIVSATSEKKGLSVKLNIFSPTSVHVSLACIILFMLPIVVQKCIIY